MLFASKNDLEKAFSITEELAQVSEFLKNFTEDDFKAGESVKISDKIKVNMIAYTTKTREEGFWEAHKKMIDVHYIVSGSELVDLNFADTLEKGPYQEEKEMYELFGEPTDTIRLDTTNNFLLLFPDEAHRTGVKIDTPVDLKKLVFKIEK